MIILGKKGIVNIIIRKFQVIIREIPEYVYPFDRK